MPFFSAVSHPRSLQSVADRPAICFCSRGCAIGLAIGLIFSVGCGQNGSAKVGETSGAITVTNPQTAADYRRLAEQHFDAGNNDQAAEAVYKALVQQPDSVETSLLAARIERARGNPEIAADAIATIDPAADRYRDAIKLRFDLLLEMERPGAAVDVLLEGLGSGLDVPEWRHKAWRILNQQGRRAAACEQALQLARDGQATEHELISLLMRTYSFPTPGMLPGVEEGHRRFANGLGKAKWYFTLAEYNRALDELTPQFENGFANAEADAFYGRLLAETQRWDRLRQWSAKASEGAKQYGDFWAGVGTYFFSQQRYEAAVAALLKSVQLDPTDRISVQRLARALLALGRNDEAERFNKRAMNIYTTENEAQVLYIAPQQTASRQKLAQALMDLGRPFETLQWLLSLAHPGDRQRRDSLQQQRLNIRNDPSMLQMAARKSLCDLDVSEFDLQPAWDELVAGGESSASSDGPVARQIRVLPRLVNRASELGLDFLWYTDVETDLKMIPIHEALGGGIAVLDYDLDGRPDVYLAQGSGDPPTDRATRSNQLFRGGEPTFINATENSGTEDFNYSSGLAAGDINQDGFPDLYLGSLGHNRLLINNGDGTFQDATYSLDRAFRSGEAGNLQRDQFTSSVAIADLNGDRLPDLFESNYIEMQGGFALPAPRSDGLLLAPSPRSYTASADRWFESRSGLGFLPHSVDASIADPGTSLGLVVTDFDADGKNEVFVANDVRPNHLLRQTGKNRFDNVADALGLANGFDGGSKGCMGVATGDFNRDSRFDFQVANYLDEEANLYLQTANGNFTDNSERYALADLTRPYVGFGTKAVDFDRNGLLDFIVSNGHVFDLERFGEMFRQPPQVLMSDGRSYQSAEVKDPSGYWQGDYLGRSIATLDYNQDGALDFLIGHLDHPVALLIDQTDAPGSSLQIELVGTESERDAIGARIVFDIGNAQYTRWVTAGDGYLCSDEPVETFGVETENAVGTLQIRWPSGDTQSFGDVPSGHRYLIVEGDDQLYRRDHAR